MENWILTIILLPALLGGSSSSYALHLQQHIVGDWIWSIPPTNNFYNDWSASRSFHIGDTLYFDFDSGLSNLVQVSRGEYDSCTGDQAFKAFMEGPAIVTLTQRGVFYFICSITSNCALGQKVSVIVNVENSMDSTPSPSPLSYSFIG